MRLYFLGNLVITKIQADLEKNNTVINIETYAKMQENFYGYILAVPDMTCRMHYPLH